MATERKCLSGSHSFGDTATTAPTRECIRCDVRQMRVGNGLQGDDDWCDIDEDCPDAAIVRRMICDALEDGEQLGDLAGWASSVGGADAEAEALLVAITEADSFSASTQSYCWRLRALVEEAEAATG